MPRFSPRNLLAASLVAALPAPVLAADAVRATADDLAEVLRDMGYRAEVGRDNVGDPMIRTSFAGANTTVFFYGCRRDVCESIQFTSGFILDESVDEDHMNGWNRNKRFLKGYIDGEGDPIAEYNVLVEDGIPEDLMRENIENWDRLLGEFQDYIGYR
jgi:hypothetical protein